MTRLHYPREFRQQSPAVWVEKNQEYQHNTRGPVGHSAMNKSRNKPPGCGKRPAPRSLSASFRIQQWANHRSPARLAATAIIKSLGRQTVRPIPDYCKCRRSHRNPEAKTRIPDEEALIQTKVRREAFTLALGRDA